MNEPRRELPFGNVPRKIPADGGESFDVAGVRFTWKVKNADTGLSLSMFEMALAPGDGVPLHCHAYAEIFYILVGEVDFLRTQNSQDEWIPALVGETVIVPINGLHAFYNRTSRPARLLSISNQLHQGFFDAVAEADRTTPFANMPMPEAMARVGAIASGFDMHFMPFEPPTSRHG